MSMFVQVDYLKAGAGHRPERFQLDPTLLPRDPAALLARQLGPLVWLRIDGVLCKLPAPADHPAAASVPVPEVAVEVAGRVPVVQAELVPELPGCAEVAVEVPAGEHPASPPPLARELPGRDDAIAQMLAAGGVALLGAGDAFEVYPRLFSSAEAARKPLARALKAHAPGAGLIELTFRTSGPGQRSRRALVTAEHLPVAREWLAVRFGPLVHFAEVPASLAGPPLDAPPAPATP